MQDKLKHLVNLMLLMSFAGVACAVESSVAGDAAWLTPYNVVWTNPCTRSVDSMPIGGGNVALNVWTTDRELCFYIGSPDCWVDGPRPVQQVKMGLVRLSFSPNPFAGEFSQKLDLASNSILVSGKASDGTEVKLSVWVDAFKPVIHVEGEASKPVSATAAVEIRRGEGCFEGVAAVWYFRNESVSTGRVQEINANQIGSIADVVPDPLGNLTCGGRLSGAGFMADETGAPASGQKRNIWRIKTASAITKIDLRATLRIEQDPSLELWKEEVERLEKKTRKTAGKDWNETCEWWSSFWARSHIVINYGKSVNDPAWEVGRNYQLFRAMLAANRSGRMPTLFNGGSFICESNPDTRQWGHAGFTAQNQRLVYWPLLKTGDADLLSVGLEFYAERHALAKAWAKHFWKIDGAVFTEDINIFGLPAYSSQNGFSGPAVLRYHYTSCMEFALMMLEQGRYTGEDIQRYVPVADGILRFFDQFYRQQNKKAKGQELDGKGQLVICPGNALEAYEGTRNDSASLAGLMALSDALLALPERKVKPDDRVFWQEFRKRLAPISTRTVKGYTCISPAAEWRVEGNQFNMELPQLYPVFPFRVYGVGRPDLDLARNTWCYGYKDEAKQKPHFCWYQGGVFTACLGLTDEAREYALAKFLHPRWPEPGVKDGKPDRRGMSPWKLHWMELPGWTVPRYPAFWDTMTFCARPDMDHGGAAMIQLQEMLLQNGGAGTAEEKKIFLLPAWPKDWDVDFKLHAPYQTTVECVFKNGKVEKLVVTPKSRAADVVNIAEQAQVKDMRCEYLENPGGVDSLRPRLSWILESVRRGERQTAYQVLVASTPELLVANTGDLWDSGRVDSDQSTQVEYGGKALASRQGCYWKVRVWLNGESLPWSAVAHWTMGLLDPESWQGKWITMKNAGGLPHPWLRRTFEIKADVAEGRVYVNTPAHYELYLNGEKVGTDVLAPAHVNLKRRFLYNVYDVSGLLRKGTNCIALWMGPGWYQPRYGNPYGAPIVRAQLELRDAAGLTVIGSDASWRVVDSCISQIGPWGWNNMGGEKWDAGKYVEGWNQVGFDDSGWAQALEIPAPKVENSWQALPGSCVRQPITAKKIYAHKDKWVIDFGTTITGWMRLRMSGLKPGQQVKIDYADLDAGRKHLAHEANNSDGFQTFNQADMYVAGKQAQDVFCSKFNQHAFRYAVVSGLSGEPELNDAEALPIMTDLDDVGEFVCSNELLNRIHQITVNTYSTQIPCGVLGGGEAREKLGYGDGGSFLSGMLYNLRSDAFFQKWLTDWCDGQGADGFLGHTAPEYYPAGGGPSWGGQASELVRRLYYYYGDRRAVAGAYPVLKKYIEHLEKNTQQDILRYFNPYNPGQKQAWYFLGDWVAPRESADKGGFSFESDEQREFFNNCYRVLLWDQLARCADTLGDQGEGKRCRDRLAVLRPLIHNFYYDAGKKTYKVNRQAYLTIALYAGVVPSELRADIMKQLEDDIVITRKGHLDTGLQGTFMLLDLLTRENRPDLVALIMNQITFPGWGFLIKERNVTTWPETWSGWGSQIIQVVGTPGVWFYEGLAGIQPDQEQPGFKRFRIRPGVVDSVSWVKCRYESPYGDIVSNWKCEDGKFEMDVMIPVNTTATLYVPVESKPGVDVPAGDRVEVTESGVAADRADGVKFLGMEQDHAIYEVGSGRYQFNSAVRSAK